MARQSDEFLTYVLEDVLGHVAGVTARAMFGGYGIYRHGVIFAIIADDQLYFKVDDTNRADYESRGSEPFVYQRPGRKPVAMPYWLVPQDILEDRQAIVHWVDRSVAVSRSAT